MTPYLAARARRRRGRHQRSPQSGISRKRNRRSAAQPARAGRVGLSAGRSADRRRWLGAPLAHEEFGARKPNAGIKRRSFNAAGLSMTPYLAARARRRRGRHQRSPQSGISRKRNRRSAAQPARAGRVGLSAGRSADRRRWLGAPLAHEEFGARKPNAGIKRRSFNAAGLASTPWLNRAALLKSCARPAPRRPPPAFARPQGEYRLNEIAEAPPSRLERVGLIAQRASRTRIRSE